MILVIFTLDSQELENSGLKWAKLFSGHKKKSLLSMVVFLATAFVT